MKLDAAPILAALESEIGELPTLLPEDIRQLADRARDPAQLRRWLKLRLAGEPLAHICGQFEFYGLSFYLDKRAYVTDPELTHLVAAVEAAARSFTVTQGRAPLIAEVGVGCGSLSLSLGHRLPAATVVGIDLDPDPLVLAAANAERLDLSLRLVESDLFESWPPDLPAPDIVFGDPPWGDDAMLYAADRPAGHYHAMPPVSAFPLGGPTGVHRQIIRQIINRGWSSEVWLNGGVIPPPALAALGEAATAYEIITPAAGLSLLRCWIK